MVLLFPEFHEKQKKLTKEKHMTQVFLAEFLACLSGFHFHGFLLSVLYYNR